MSIPLWVLLGFAGWTLLLIMVGVGYERWRLILRGEAGPADFPADEPHGSPRYRRIMRAHANCVENLPVYGAIAVVVTAAGATGALVDGLALTFLGARVLQTSVHVALPQTNRVVSFRASFFIIQLACMVAMGLFAASASLG
jgi:uncharacterized MAPEG superfamily protein